MMEYAQGIRINMGTIFADNIVNIHQPRVTIYEKNLIAIFTDAYQYGKHH
jgi:hypothetical protein